MTRTRASATLAFATFFAAAAATGSLVMPVASADTLSNGLTVTCSQDSDVHSTCVVGGCPRVNGDYVVDALHVTYPGGSQSEFGFKCINGETHRVGSIGDPVLKFAVQACRKKDFEHDWCVPYVDYTYTPPAKAAPVVVAPKADVPVVVPPITCPAGSPTPTVPAGGTCAAVPIAPPSTNSVSMSTSGAGLGKINVTFANSANIAATCAYTATPNDNPLGILPTINKTVTVKANGTGSLNGEKSPPPLTSYHLRATCTGTFQGAEVQLGSPETDVSG